MAVLHHHLVESFKTVSIEDQPHPLGSHLQIVQLVFRFSCFTSQPTTKPTSRAKPRPANLFLQRQARQRRGQTPRGPLVAAQDFHGEVGQQVIRGVHSLGGAPVVPKPFVLRRQPMSWGHLFCKKNVGFWKMT